MELYQLHNVFAFIYKRYEVIQFLIKTKRENLFKLLTAYDNNQYYIEDWKYSILKDYFQK